MPLFFFFFFFFLKKKKKKITRTSTPTGRSPTRRTCPRSRSSAGAATISWFRARTGPARRALHSRHARPPACSVLALIGCARRAPTRRHPRLRLGCVPVHPVRLEREHERRHLPPCSCGASGWSRSPGARGAASRSRAGRSSGRCSSLRSGPRTPRGCAGRGLFAAGFLVATELAFSILLFRASPWHLHALGVFWHHTFGLQLNRRLAVLDLGLAAIPRRAARPALAAAPARGAARSARPPSTSCRGGSRPPAHRAHGGGAARVRARADPLVLPVRPWFFPFAAFAVLAPAAEPLRAPVPAPPERPRQELVGVD